MWLWYRLAEAIAPPHLFPTSALRRTELTSHSPEGSGNTPSSRRSRIPLSDRNINVSSSLGTLLGHADHLRSDCSFSGNPGSFFCPFPTILFLPNLCDWNIFLTIRRTYITIVCSFNPQPRCSASVFANAGVHTHAWAWSYILRLNVLHLVQSRGQRELRLTCMG